MKTLESSKETKLDRHTLFSILLAEAKRITADNTSAHAMAEEACRWLISRHPGLAGERHAD